MSVLSSDQTTRSHPIYSFISIVSPLLLACSVYVSASIDCHVVSSCCPSLMLPYIVLLPWLTGPRYCFATAFTPHLLECAVNSRTSTSDLATLYYSIMPYDLNRACTVCRRLKMKCVGAENGPPCKRCIAGKHQCIFEESNRGKRTSKKHEVLTKSIKKMEAQLETVMRSLKNPTIANLVAQNGGIPGIIPAGNGNGVISMGDNEEMALASPSESVRSLPPDESLQQQSRHSFSHSTNHLGNGNGNPYATNTSRPSFGESPSGSGLDDGGYHSTSQQQLTRNTEHLTSHSPIMHSPSSPRVANGAMNPPMSHTRGSYLFYRFLCYCVPTKRYRTHQ